MMAPRRAWSPPGSGTVKLHSTSARASCMLYLNGKSGTEYLYVHLNNDLTEGNDNRGRCVPGVAYATGLKSGARVAAGEVIGYVGDSGDADGMIHHHFEVHPDGGAAIGPFPYLNKARRLLFAAQLVDVHARADGQGREGGRRGSPRHGRACAAVARQPARSSR